MVRNDVKGGTIMKPTLVPTTGIPMPISLGKSQPIATSSSQQRGPYKRTQKATTRNNNAIQKRPQAQFKRPQQQPQYKVRVRLVPVSVVSQVPGLATRTNASHISNQMQGSTGNSPSTSNSSNGSQANGGDPLLGGGGGQDPIDLYSPDENSQLIDESTYLSQLHSVASAVNGADGFISRSNGPIDSDGDQDDDNDHFHRRRDEVLMSDHPAFHDHHTYVKPALHLNSSADHIYATDKRPDASKSMKNNTLSQNRNGFTSRKDSSDSNSNLTLNDDSEEAGEDEDVIFDPENPVLAEFSAIYHETIFAYLDLIQHQQEQLLKKDRQLQGLKQDREALCLRMNNMQNRIDKLSEMLAATEKHNESITSALSSVEVILDEEDREIICENDEDRDISPLSKKPRSRSQLKVHATPSPLDQAAANLTPPVTPPQLPPQPPPQPIVEHAVGSCQTDPIPSPEEVSVSTQTPKPPEKTYAEMAVQTDIDYDEMERLLTAPRSMVQKPPSSLPPKKRPSYVYEQDTESIVTEDLDDSQSAKLHKKQKTREKSSERRVEKADVIDAKEAKDERLRAKTPQPEPAAPVSSSGRVLVHDVLTTDESYDLTISRLRINNPTETTVDTADECLPEILAEMALKKPTDLINTKSLSTSGHSYFANLHKMPRKAPSRKPISRQAEIEIPSFRVAPVAPCYSMEGTENLEDVIFLKRHNKPEQDEKRRKRWDLQRLRELRQTEKLKQGRYNNTTPGGDKRPKDAPLCSFFPESKEVQYVEVVEKLPVIAFGHPLPALPKRHFSLPWSLDDDSSLDGTNSSNRNDETRSRSSSKAHHKERSSSRQDKSPHSAGGSARSSSAGRGASSTGHSSKSRPSKRN